MCPLPSIKTCSLLVTLVLLYFIEEKLTCLEREYTFNSSKQEVVVAHVLSICFGPTFYSMAARDAEPDRPADRTLLRACSATPDRSSASSKSYRIKHVNNEDDMNNYMHVIMVI